MTTSSRRPVAQPRWAALPVVACALALAACSGGGDRTATPSTTTTTTITPSATASPSPSSSASPTVSTDVKGRGYDVGTIQDATTKDGVTTVELDRWSVDGTSDTKLAKNGLPVAPHRGDRFDNQSHKTYSAPLAPDATAFTNTCKATGDADDDLGMTSKPTDARDFVDGVSDRTVVLLSYDAQGRVVRIDTDPRCTGDAPQPPASSPPAGPTTAPPAGQ